MMMPLGEHKGQIAAAHAAHRSEVEGLTALLEDAAKQLVAVAKERDEARTRVAELEVRVGELVADGLDLEVANENCQRRIVNTETRAEKAEADAARLREALDEYATHQGRCASLFANEACVCGLDAALAGKEEP